ncbi:PDZ domain-containing protein [candidate division KSB1 bacterium]
MSGKNIYNKISIVIIVILGLIIFASVLGIGIGEAFWNGMTIDPLNFENREYYNLSIYDTGVVVVEVKGKAEKAGIEEGDLITGINGVRVYDINSFLSAAKATKSSNNIVMDLKRDGNQTKFSLPGEKYNKSGIADASQVNLGLFTGSPFYLTANTNTSGGAAQSGRIPSEGNWLGMELEGITPGTIRELNLPANQTGVVVDDVPPGSLAEKGGLKNGDIIRSINGQIIINMADYIKATNNQNIKTANLEIVRNGKLFFLTIPTAEISNSSVSRIQPKSNPAPSITIDAVMPHEYRGVCVKCHKIIEKPIWENNPVNSPLNSFIQDNTGLPSPAQQNAAQKVLVEGHWLGMELIPITSELAIEYKLPRDVGGLLVDEVTLEAAESGLLAGDVLQSINGYPVKTLDDFAKATRQVETFKEARLGVLHNGNPLSLILQSSWGKLGVSQNEAAQPIQPGAISPHRNRGRPCTDCHIIMKNGGQLPTDAGDILPNPPPISSNAKAPHSYRGKCNTCHTIFR